MDTADTNPASAEATVSPTPTTASPTRTPIETETPTPEPTETPSPTPPSEPKTVTESGIRLSIYPRELHTGYFEQEHVFIVNEQDSTSNWKATSFGTTTGTCSYSTRFCSSPITELQYLALETRRGL